MTIEEYEKLSSKLTGKELIDFINENPENARQYANELIKKSHDETDALDDHTLKKMWQEIVAKIESKE